MLETLLLTLLTQLSVQSGDPGPAGGLRSDTTTAITAQTTTGSPITGGTATADNIRSLGGHTGTLADPLTLLALADPPSVPETNATQLSAAAVLDDASLLQVSPLWETVSGPVATISPTGHATTANVFRDEPATARATYLDLTSTADFTVVNTATDDFRTYANDGLDDAWQFTHFGLDNPDAAPLLDPDLDGQNNTFEFRAGVTPTDPASRFEVSLTPTLDGLSFSPYLPDRTYTLLSAGSPSPSTLAPLSGTTLTPSTGTATITGPASPAPPLSFYRLRITFP